MLSSVGGHVLLCTNESYGAEETVELVTGNLRRVFVSRYTAQWLASAVVELDGGCPIFAALFSAPGTVKNVLSELVAGGRRKRLMQWTWQATYVLRLKRNKQTIFKKKIKKISCCRFTPPPNAIPNSTSLRRVLPRYIACIPAPLFLLRPQFTPPYVLLPLSGANGRNCITCFSLLKGWADTVKNSSNSNKMQVNGIHPRLTWLQTKFMTLCFLRNIDPSPAGDLPWHEAVTGNKTLRDLCTIMKLHLTLLP